MEVRPSARGLATIYDKEIVLYIGSLMASKIDEGGGHRAGLRVRRVRPVQRHRREPFGAVLCSRCDALERLQGTQIRTNIEAGG